jgi:hypothetical protein
MTTLSCNWSAQRNNSFANLGIVSDCENFTCDVLYGGCSSLVFCLKLPVNYLFFYTWR